MRVHVLLYTSPFSSVSKSLFEDDAGLRARPKMSLLDEDIVPTVLTAESGDGEREVSGMKKQPERLFHEEEDEEDHTELLE